MENFNIDEVSIADWSYIKNILLLQHISLNNHVEKMQTHGLEVSEHDTRRLDNLKRSIDILNKIINSKK